MKNILKLLTFQTFLFLSLLWAPQAQAQSCPTNCQWGCLNSSCLPYWSKASDSCYLRLVLSERFQGEQPVIGLKSVSAIVGNFFALVSPEMRSDSDAMYAAELQTATGVKLKKFGFNSELLLPHTEHLPESALPTQAELEVYLPFFGKATNIQISAAGKQITSFKLPSNTLKCERACVASGKSGFYNKHKCCSGTVSQKVNSTVFMCLASPSPSPSASATPNPAAF